MRGNGSVTRLLVLVALAALAGCAGDVVSGPDGQAGTVDLWTGGESLAAGDPTTPQPRTDLSPGPTAADAAVSFDECSKWSAWTCQEIPAMLCKATCATATKTYSLSCLKKGGCVCEFSTGLCGPYSYTQPCDACRQALEKGCCEQL